MRTLIRDTVSVLLMYAAIYALVVLVIIPIPPEQQQLAALEMTEDQTIRLTLDSEGPKFDPYAMPDPLSWQPQFRCRLQEGIDGYGRIVAPVETVPFTPTEVSEINPVIIPFDMTGVRGGIYGVFCRLELMNWMGDWPVYTHGYTDEEEFQTPDGIGWQYVGTIIISGGSDIYLPMVFRSLQTP